jgi:beta-lactam-binding protein with PASTA domain
MTNRTKKVIKVSGYVLAVIIFIVIMDRVVMPFYVKLGKEIRMPEVTNLSAEEAAQLLKQQGFQVIFQDSIFSAVHPVGTVIAQNPYASAMVKDGRRVYLTISSGEKPAIMPDLIGKSPLNAGYYLKNACLRLGTLGYKSSSLVPAGAVAEQSFPVGQELKPGTLVGIKICTGQVRNILPDLRSLSLSDVQQSLERLGLQVGEITYEEREDFLPKTVIFQSPQPGSPFKTGDKIDLKVSKLPEDG